MCVCILAARFCPRFACRCPSKMREQGMPDARCTRGLACKTGSENAHEHTGSAEAIRHSLRNGFTAYNALSLATNSSCHHRLRIDGRAEPGRACKTSADLTPATDARTTRLHRTQPASFVCVPLIAHGAWLNAEPALPSHFTPNAAASTASRPASLTIRIRPSVGRDGDGYIPESGEAAREIFGKRSAPTKNIENNPMQRYRPVAGMCAP